MRKPENPPPNWLDVLQGTVYPNQPPSNHSWQFDLFKTLMSPEVTAMVARANHEYLHWHKFRFWPMPKDLTATQGWTAVVMSRQLMLQQLDLTAIDGSKFQYCTPPRHQQWLHRIDKKSGGLPGDRPRNGDGDDRFLFNSLMEEAIASSQLEGAATTRTVAKELLRTKRKPRTKHEQMIVNNYNAILEIRDLKHEPLTPSLLCQIHEIITHRTLDHDSESGRFRTAADRPVSVVDIRDDEILHIAPDAVHLEGMIGELCQFANNKPTQFMHPVVKAIVLHFAIGYIHPFVDGNGRTARAIFYWFMLKNGYWIFEYLPISRIILDAPGRYMRAFLYTESDSSDLTYFIHYNLRVIDKAVHEMLGYIQRRDKQVQRAREVVDSIPGLNTRQICAAYEVVRKPHEPLTVKGHAGFYRISLQTARSDLTHLVDAGVLQSRINGKVCEFTASPNLKKMLKSGAFREHTAKQKEKAGLVLPQVPIDVVAEQPIPKDNPEDQ